jgi:hypothetical protein
MRGARLGSGDTEQTEPSSHEEQPTGAHDATWGGEHGAHQRPSIMELGFLSPLYVKTGPVASVYLDTTRASEMAAKEVIYELSAGGDTAPPLHSPAS